MYHFILEDMLLENVTVSEEWFDLAGEVYSVPDLTLLLHEYSDQLLAEALALNATNFHMDMTIESIGDFDLESAQAHFFELLGSLQESNQSLSILMESTVLLGERLGADPGILLQDLFEVEVL